MARDRAFTDEQIVSAANELQLAGKAINGTSLRNVIGIGRPSNLMDVFKELESNGLISVEQEIVEQSPEVKRIALPIELADMLSVIMGDVESMIHKINDHAHFVVEQRLNSAIAEANQRAAEAAKKQVDIEREMEKAFNQVEDFREQLNNAVDDLQSSKTQVMLLERKNLDLEGDIELFIIEKTELKAQISDKDNEIKVIKSELVTTEKQLSVEIGKNQVLASDLEAKKAEFKRLTEAKEVSDQLRFEAVGELKSLTTSFEKSEKICLVQSEKIEVLSLKVGELEEVNKTLNAQVSSDSKQILTLEKKLTSLNKVISDLRAE